MPGKPEDYPNLASPETQQTGLKFSLRRGLAKAKDALFPMDKKIPIEEIDAQKTAEVILTRLGNPLRERAGQGRYANPFDITDVLSNMGYMGLLVNTDFLKKHPQAYQAAKQALWQLEQEGVLEHKDFDEPDARGETIAYKVLDSEKLKVVASKPKQ